LKSTTTTPATTTGPRLLLDLALLQELLRLVLLLRPLQLLIPQLLLVIFTICCLAVLPTCDSGHNPEPPRGKSRNTGVYLLVRRSGAFGDDAPPKRNIPCCRRLKTPRLWRRSSFKKGYTFLSPLQNAAPNPPWRRRVGGGHRRPERASGAHPL
jgi:hypothetical protein